MRKRLIDRLPMADGKLSDVLKGCLKFRSWINSLVNHVVVPLSILYMYRKAVVRKLASHSRIKSTLIFFLILQTSKWIEKVAGVNIKCRKWTNYVTDETVHPRPEFITAFFENIGKSFPPAM
jgi:hypothetical protein